MAKRKQQDKRDDVAPPASGGPVRHLLLGLLGLQALALGVKAVDDRFQSDDAARSEQDRTSLIIAERLTQRARLVRNAIEVSARTGASRSLTAEASEDIERILTLADAALSDDPRIIAATETASGLLASGETVGLSKEGDIVVAVSLTGSGDILGIAPATDWLPLPVGDLKYSLIGDTEIALGNQEVKRGAAIDRPGGIITTALGGRTVSACAPVSGGDLTICTARPLAWVEARDAGRLAFYLLLLLGPALALFGLDHENRKQQAARHNAEKDSETSSRLVDLIMQSAGAGHWEWEEDGERVLISPEFASLLGRSGETSITAADFLDFVYAADRDSMAAAIRDSRATGHIHTIFRARNGHHQQYYLEIRGQRVHDGDTGRMRFIGIITDVTQQKLAENKLKASEMRLRNALDGFNQPFALWDQRKRLTNWNDAFVRDFGLGETVRPQMSYDTFEMVKASTIRLERESEGERAREVWLKDGRWLKIVERATPDGGLITMGIDISGNVESQESLRGQQEKLKRFLRKLEHSEAHAAEMARKYQEEKTRAEQASKSKSAFLANVSHELRTPLNAINGFSEMLISEIFGPLGDPRYKDYAGDILTSGQHLLDMINDILDMAKIEAGKMTINTRPIDPVDPVDAAVRMVRHRAEDAGVNLTLEAGDLPMIEADHRAVRQMMLNLLSNAIKFTDAGGRVAVSLTRKEGFVRIAVRDTGVGIPKEALPRLGKPFEQVRETADRNYEGTGLGLALTKSFAEMHGGRISIASEPGKGTLVAIYLPLARPNTGAADEPATDRPSEAAE